MYCCIINKVIDNSFVKYTKNYATCFLDEFTRIMILKVVHFFNNGS